MCRDNPDPKRGKYDSLGDQSEDRGDDALVHPAGFEPTAPGLGILCSILLSYECTSDFFNSGV